MGAIGRSAFVLAVLAAASCSSTPSVTLEPDAIQAAARCGDGVQQPAEACDPTVGTGANTPAMCNPDCTVAACGDGQVNPSFVVQQSPRLTEQCDGTPGCTPLCQLPACGDGFVDPAGGEECDDGAANSANGPCLPDCSLGACGDQIVESADTVAEDGAANGPEMCDDGVELNGHEACPYGSKVACTNLCSATCAQVTGTATFCGDGVLNGGEECDDGAANGDETCTAYDGSCLICSAGCQVSAAIGPHCGDNLRQAGNETGTTCPGDCFCGNGTIDAGELCDGTNVGTATCALFGAGATGTLLCAAGCESYDLSECIGPTTVTVTFVSGAGTSTIVSTPAGIACTTSPCIATFAVGTAVVLTATFKGGDTGVTWIGCTTHTATTCSFTLAETVAHITATFEP